MKRLFKKFIQETKANGTVSDLCIKFNHWLVAFNNQTGKNVTNELNKFMVRKWITKGKIVFS